MSWMDAIDAEFNRGREAAVQGNEGKVRTSARRAVGIAVTEYQRRLGSIRYGKDVMAQLRSITDDTTLASEVREAARRLQTRISPEFTSPSLRPLEDAMVIIDFIRQELTS
jgi:uncharacterized protein (UPF0147 family)